MSKRVCLPSALMGADSARCRVRTLAASEQPEQSGSYESAQVRRVNPMTNARQATTVTSR